MAPDLIAAQTPPNPEQTMSEQVEQAPKRRNKVAEEKEALRAQIAAMANKVPAKVNAGSIQDTRAWVAENEKVQHLAAGGYQRKSRRQLREMLAKAEAWRQ